MSLTGLEFRLAQFSHQNLLSDLALRSKASWGYTKGFLEKFKAELTVPERCLKRNLVQMGYLNQKLIGFYSFSENRGKEPDLNFFFLEPEFKAQGLGRALFENAVETAKSYGWISFLICSDPNASAFYQHMGALWVGTLDLPDFPEHSLPIFRYILS